MYTKTSICNQAIGFAGETQNLTDLDTDRSAMAIACRAVYQNYVDSMLESYNWSFSGKIYDLVQVDSNAQGYEYAYNLPNDFLKAVALATTSDDDLFLLNNYSLWFFRDLPLRLRNAYKIALNDDSDHRILLTNLENARLLYTFRVQESLFSAAFVEALSLKLAAYIVTRVPHSSSLAKELRAEYKEAIDNATVIDANGQNLAFETVTDSAKVRIC